MASTLSLTLAYWLHMAATVVWVGGLVSLALLVFPAAQKTLPDAHYAAFTSRIIQRLDALGWFSLVLLTATGMFQMSAHPSYEGFLAISTTWGAAILVKHLLIIVMVGFSAFLTWGVLPSLRRLALLQASGKEGPEGEQARMGKTSRRLLTINLILALFVLALTALARVS